MAHSSGIQVSEELRKEFSNGEFRSLFIQIKDEKLVVVNKFQRKQDLKQDYEIISATIKSTTDPYFIIFQIDSSSPSSSNAYLLVSYIPEAANVLHSLTIPHNTNII